VTFSDRRVAEFINARFVAAWVNRGVGFHNEDYSAEQSILTSSFEAYPTKNICTFFMTPSSEVFHYVAGHFAPELFLPELETACRIRREAFDDRMSLKPDGLDTLRFTHRDAARRSEELGKNPPVARGEVAYREFTHTHSDACAWTIHAGARYLAALHDHWSKRAALPTLDKVRLDYLYGNEFTEEPRRGALHVAGTCTSPIGK
jgi:hypothetical protein